MRKDSRIGGLTPYFQRVNINSLGSWGQLCEAERKDALVMWV